MITDLISKIKFDLDADRLGPDCPFTHWKLYFRNCAFKLCKNKFDHFGEGASIRPGAYIITCSKIKIGNNVTIRPQTMLFASPIDDDGIIEIHDNVLIGSGVHIYVSNHRYDCDDIDICFQGHEKAKPVVIGKGAWIGANTVILPGIIVGENSVVGAGSIVTKNVEPGSIVAGNPARVLRENV